MSMTDKIFQDMIDKIMLHGSTITTRNSVTKRLTNLGATFVEAPLVSVRKTAWKSAIREMEWFMSGSNDIQDLHESVRKWWEPWADENGQILNNYSDQFRGAMGADEEPCDQIEYLKNAIKEHPYSRRSVITTWNTSDMANPETLITNCHGTMIQCFVEPRDNSLHMTMYQRSSDMLLGLQHNWIQYWALLMYLAHHGGRKVGSFTWIGGDCHVYESHFEVGKEITDEQVGDVVTPKLVYNPTSEDFKAKDFTLEGEYKPLLTKSLPMVV